ncbi:MAG: hypothetical protein CMC18_02260 [Flavobacteriaceae bacterium]|nr:hypothetical protein [Flavobacteriaceae bacterium]
MRSVNHLANLCLSLVLASCAITPKVAFENYVDTRSKPIRFQEKKTYSFDSAGVYFSNDFNGARLNSVQQLNDSTYRLGIWPENIPINPSPYYAFKVWSDTQQSLILQFDYPDAYRHRYLPKIKEDRSWVAADSISFQQIENQTLLTLKVNSSPKLISAQELHSSNEVYAWVDNLVKGKDSYVQFKEIGKTVLKRSFKVIDICKGSAEGKPVVVFITRQHPPEVTGYFAFQSFISTLLESGQESEAFLAKYRVLAFPLMNPDGVDLGHWRHNSGGVDLNRDWSKYHQKEIKTTVDFISKTLKASNSELVLGLDFHSTYYDVFYTNEERAATHMPNFLESWFSGLEANIPDYEVNEKPSNSTQPVSKGWFLNKHKAVGVVFEIGDDTPRNRIRIVGKQAALSMMSIMNSN